MGPWCWSWCLWDAGLWIQDDGLWIWDAGLRGFVAVLLELLRGVVDQAGEVWGEEQPLPPGDEWLPINTCQGARKRWVDYPAHSMR